MSFNMNIIEKIIKCQVEIENARKKIEKKEFSSQIGDVTIVLQGNKKVIDIKINSEKIMKDKELLQENILLAFNDALDKIDISLRKKVNKITGDL